MTRGNLVTNIRTRLSISAGNVFFADATVQNYADLAHKWAAGLHKWPQLYKAKTTSTIASQEYYDYPSTFKTGSIDLIQLGEEYYTERTFKDYLKYKSQQPTDTNTRMFANYNRQYFIFPTPASVLTISLWGLEMPATFTTDSDVTVFGDSEPEADESIIKKAVSMGLAKAGLKKEGQAEEAEAIALLTNVWNRLKEDTADQCPSTPMFDVPDFFGSNHSTNIGNF